MDGTDRPDGVGPEPRPEVDGPGPVEHPLDAVAQARAWLTAQTGQVPGAEDVLPTHQPPADSPGRMRWSGAATAAASGEHDGTDDPDDPDADAENVARTIALRKLTAQARTRHELDQALQKKNVPDEVAASVLDRLEEVRLVDDQTFAQDWVASRQRRRHLSRSALRRELRGKGVDREHVDAALATVDIDDELAAARALVAKKAAASRGLTAVVRHRRLAGALARRGFSSGIIATVLGELDDEPADEPAGDGDA